jgi:putative MATE family efflux protein
MELNNYIIKTAIRRYVLPTVFSTVSVVFCQLVDAVMMGRILGEAALAAGCLCFPITGLFAFFTGCLGTGGGTLFSENVAKGDRTTANRIFTVCTLFTFLLGILMSLLGIFAAPQIAAALGAKGQTVTYTTEYAKYFLMGAPLILSATVIQNFLRNDNSPKQAMIAVFITNIINIILDYVFMAIMGFGAAGAAFALIIGSFCSIVYSFIVHRGFKFIRSGLGFLADSAKTGVGGSMAMLFSVVVQFTCNRLLVNIAGEAGPAINGVVNNINFLGMSVFLGICTAMAPITSTFFGEKDYESLKSTLKQFIKIVSVISIILALVQFIFAAPLTGLFGIEEATRANGTIALRIMSISLLTLGFALVPLFYYQSVGVPKLAALIAIARVFLFLMPLMIILSYIFGLNGIWWGRSIAEVFTVAAALILGFIVGKKRNLSPVFLTPKEPAKDEYRYMMKNNMENITSLHEKINDFCEKRGFDQSKKNAVCLVIEEMTANICQYGFREGSQHYIDIRIGFSGSDIIIRIRDDGKLFNPLDYIEKHPDPEKLSLGLTLLKKTAKSLSYDRIMSFNNLVITL